MEHTDNINAEDSKNLQWYFEMLTLLNEFNDKEVSGVLHGQLGKSQEENCYYATYVRAQRDVKSALKLNSTQDYQAVAMLARSMMELNADVHMLEKTDNAVRKYIAFNTLERLRFSENMAACENGEILGVHVEVSVYKDFYESHWNECVTECGQLWPDKKIRDIKHHWTLMYLDRRAEDSGDPVKTIYRKFNKPFSWEVHSGGMSVSGIDASYNIAIYAMSLHYIYVLFEDLVINVSKKFHLEKVINKMEDKLTFVKFAPGCDSEEQINELRNELGLT